jgi:hypothetical protein
MQLRGFMIFQFLLRTPKCIFYNKLDSRGDFDNILFSRVTYRIAHDKIEGLPKSSRGILIKYRSSCKHKFQVSYRYSSSYKNNFLQLLKPEAL